MTIEYHKGSCMVHACLCCHAGLVCKGRPEETNVCVAWERKILCIHHSCCLSPMMKSKGIGIVTDKDNRYDICKVGAVCCDFGLNDAFCDHHRDPMCSYLERCGCLYFICSCPPNHRDYVPTPVCSYYGIQCYPQCTCCGPPPRSVAMERLLGLEDTVKSTGYHRVMDRDHDDNEVEMKLTESKFRNEES
eukprot:CAMPEP_0178885080 /NCGR_PEP_ID=MMETSP0747-20121128/15149_1 /TAXON_ID=913974 /ORGANISM="Nitzschia punctata, Strain CCMP561" /LENGTH=189 /DNA_ID=CAMNT_0020553703 /DNA_START=30 /DNA_END=599 /DNA_ORIENTATION=-